MNEELFGKRIVWHLDRSLTDIDHTIANSLAAARHAALAGQPVEHPAHAMALLGDKGGRSEHRPWSQRFWITIAAVVLGLAVIGYWQQRSTNSMLIPNHESSEIDAGLLSDDLPINAYLDKGFDAWLEDTSE